MPLVTPSMSGLFRRLAKIGFDENFVRRAVLPDWWDDSLFADPTSRAQVELRIAQRLSLPLEDVVEHHRPLRIASAGHVCLKRAKAGAEREKIAPGLIAARNAIELIVPYLRGVPPLPANLSAKALRESILRNRTSVDFGSLVDACWAHGVAVLNFTPPAKAKKFAGMAYYQGTRPVIVLASGYDSPPRQAFYLAHEMSHVFRGHVKPGEMLADADLDGAAEDVLEHEADADALEILTGQANPTFTQQYGMTAPKLANAALAYERTNKIHAGTTALIYGRTAKRMAVAISALKLLKMDVGARAITANALRRRVCPSEAAIAELPGAVVEVLPVFGIEV